MQRALELDRRTTPHTKTRNSHKQPPQRRNPQQPQTATPRHKPESNASYRLYLAEVLAGLGQVGADRIFGNILDRLSGDTRNEYDELVWPSKEWIKQQNPKAVGECTAELMDKAHVILDAPGVFGGPATSFCHLAQTERCVEEVQPGAVRICAAGVTCTDWSSEGARMGWAGQSTKPCMLWVAERRARQEEFIFQECVISPSLEQYVRQRFPPT